MAWTAPSTVNGVTFISEPLTITGTSGSSSTIDDLDDSRKPFTVHANVNNTTYDSSARLTVDLDVSHDGSTWQTHISEWFPDLSGAGLGRVYHPDRQGLFPYYRLTWAASASVTSDNLEFILYY